MSKRRQWIDLGMLTSGLGVFVVAIWFEDNNPWSPVGFGLLLTYALSAIGVAVASLFGGYRKYGEIDGEGAKRNQIIETTVRTPEEFVMWLEANGFDTDCIGCDRWPDA